MKANNITQIQDHLTPLRIELCSVYDEGNWPRVLELTRQIDAYQLALWDRDHDWRVSG